VGFPPFLREPNLTVASANALTIEDEISQIDAHISKSTGMKRQASEPDLPNPKNKKPKIEDTKPKPLARASIWLRGKAKEEPALVKLVKGLTYRDLIVGTGPVATETSSVTFKFTRTLKDGSVIHSSPEGRSVCRVTPFKTCFLTFWQYLLKIGSPDVIPGGWHGRCRLKKLVDMSLIAWNLGIIGMQAGGTRELIVPPAVGFSETAPNCPVGLNKKVIITYGKSPNMPSS
jgi:FKBP-type peptidyl-prolyl cis-trans isomerase